MALTSGQRGKVFERFILEVLKSCGFTNVVPDDQIIYEVSGNIMLHGLAQPHNTDVLVDPPFQIPFFFPSRLIVECKCLKEQVGLPVIRNALGLRTDVNGFDIVTEAILNKRRNYRRAGLAVFKRDRCFYQVAVASFSGFSKPAEEFALVHGIQLINIERMPFSNVLRSFLLPDNLNGEQLEDGAEGRDPDVAELWQDLRARIGDTLKNFYIAVLSSGDLLFLYTDQGGKWLLEDEDVELHWAESLKLWQIKPYGGNQDQQAWFELPDRLFEQWAQMSFSRDEAISLKEKEFQRVYVMGQDANGVLRLNVLRISSSFIKEARERLKIMGD